MAYHLVPPGVRCRATRSCHPVLSLVCGAGCRMQVLEGPCRNKQLGVCAAKQSQQVRQH